ncbi:Pls/PosA family non-ribosomal peptide synthetase [Mucilaginibacter sp. KACC 22063]|uniref:Pls/PosA family non-ribosomal peptide synthetase n=1 Tax=Mucilaginibacter sp. KACC 22063 TaxID=3025666 RepID=UPI0023654793|nr:Pls/PosA family non-ribosomal peptide synthetase [Mucilaginibacter sp. KACC 22063]WDF53944.1 amino acid adenylation domain-containing protein [Mucilaginibacter sp. KACC 22063]
MLKYSLLEGENKPDLIREETIADLFRSVVSIYNNKTALIFGTKKLSYVELDRWSDAIAQFIAAHGIGAGQSIGVWYPRSLELQALILGIVKSGAAYVPLDREMPEERVQVVMEEVGASACFTDADPALVCQLLRVPAFPEAEAEITPPAGPNANDRAYVLYTSGSTGRPKGIPILHRNISHLIRSEQHVIGIKPEDKVYQGFSVSFDMWCEENWISLFAGATIWIADATTAKSIDELSDVLRREQITILHAVPSLLAVIDDDIPTLRLINAGGEACTQAVLDRWSKPGKNVFYNSYGPTETTVTSTMVALKPRDIISIGGPLPNYNLAVIDEHFNLLPVGQQGQLIISGPGVCNGYVNRPELTSEKFLNKPASLIDLPGDRIYLSGDAVIMQADGRIDFKGRLDDQIKLRGYRIELGEIEVQLNALSNVKSAAVALKKDNHGQDQLVGYVTLNKPETFVENDARAELSKLLPAYMLPLIIVVMEQMPRLPSGKIDRKSLPVPDMLLNMQSADDVKLDADATLPDRVMFGLKQLFPGREIKPEMDFFTDLGGHSLLAATFSSWLRSEGNVPHATLKDIYTNRPVNNLIHYWEQSEKKNTQQKQKEPFAAIPPLRYLFCGLMQGIALLLIYGLFAIQIFIPYLGYYYVVARTESGRADRGLALVTALILYCLVPPLLSLISVGVKWLVLGKMKEGTYPLWGTYYFRYWFVNTLLRLIPTQFMNGTPIYPVFLRSLGIKVAKDAQISSITVGAWDLIDIGADVSLSSGVVLDNVSVENGRITFSKIKIGDHAYVGSNAVIAGGSEIQEWGELSDLSYLPFGQKILPYEVWKGSPAEKVKDADPDSLPKGLRTSNFQMYSFSLLYTVLLIVFPVVVLLPLWPVIEILNYMDLNAPDYDFSYFIHVPLLTLLYVGVYALETIVLSRLLLRNIKPGVYPVYSSTYVRKWLSDQLISVALIVLHPIYATVFVSWFFRLLGAKIGKNTEISTASNVTHTMLEIGDESFIADAVSLGEEDIRGQQLVLERTTIGNSSFVGNSALIPQGYQLGDRMLIGVLSVPPSKEQISDNPMGDWFGSPAIALPHRQDSGSYDKSLTTQPSLSRKLARGTVELIRIILPETIIICCSVLFVAYCHDLVKNRGVVEILKEMPKLPFYYLYYMGLPAFFTTVLLKWVVVGRYKHEQKPMWTPRVWLSEAITTTYEALAVPFFLDFLRGTPYLPAALRLLGVKIGKRVWMNTTDITEYDMVSIGTDSALNEDCGPQTHLFEDRVMKVGAVNIGERCSVGARTIILYDSELGNDVSLQPLSLVMKGEKLAASTSWTGSPIKAL